MKNEATELGLAKVLATAGVKGKTAREVIDAFNNAGFILSGPTARIEWPDPTPEMLASPEFKKIWRCIKRWDINVPDAYSGYCGATGNHVRAIFDALRNEKRPRQSVGCDSDQ